MKYKDIQFITPSLFNIPNDDTDSQWRKYFEDHGYVVFSNILTDDEQKEYIDMCWKDMISVSPTLRREDVTTWTNANFPGLINKGMCCYSGFGNCDFVWLVRLHPHIRSIFKAFWKTDDLVTSMDGFSVFYNKTQKPGTWLHLDQAYTDTTPSIQGAYNFYPVNNKSSGFVCIDGSHKHIHETDEKRFGQLVDQHQVVQKLIIPANCFTIWSSKLIHANVGPSVIPKDRLERLTTYISFFPRSMETEEIRREKCKAYSEGVTTSHYAYLCQRKTMPFFLRISYGKKGFHTIVAKTDQDGSIPAERLAYL